MLGLFFLIIQCVAFTSSFEIEKHWEQDGLWKKDSYGKKNGGAFEELDIDKIQLFFDTFRQELSAKDEKKIYSKLNVLALDTRRFVNSKAIVSNNEINKFIDNELQLIHKEFGLYRDLGQFYKEYYAKTDFVVLNNVVDEEMFKSRDWQIKKNDF